MLILAGDHIYKMDYGRMLAFHANHQADMTVACIDVPIDEAREFGVMGVDDDRARRRLRREAAEPAAHPRPARPRAGHRWASISSTPKFLFEQLERDALTKGSSHDFGKDIIPHIVPRYRVFAHRFAESCVGSDDSHKPYWRDVGTIDAYWEANMEMTKVTPELNLYDKDWPIWTYQEQLPPAKFVFDDDDRRGTAIDSLVSGGCIISGATVKRSLLFSSVGVHSWARVEDSVILPGAIIGRRAVIKRCIIDKHCRIPEGMVIGVNPEEDRKRFHVSPKGITLVTAEMLGQGAAARS